MDLTISIVNWNVREYLKKCLYTVFAYAKGLSLEVYVVDNASTDNSVAMVKETFPQVKIIENARNIGYGCAHNQVFPKANGRYILCLNPDTELLPDVLEGMVKFMQAHPEAGASTCIEISQKGERVIPLAKWQYLLFRFYRAMNRFFPNGITVFVYTNFIGKALLFPSRRRRLMRPQFIENGFLFLRRDALRQAEGFAFQFFFGNEAKDLTGRMARAGWELYIVPQIAVIHYDGKSREQLSDAEIAEFTKNHKNHQNNLRG